MAHQLTRRANHTVEVAATLDPDAVARERATIVRDFRRRARVPGFRPGRAPEAAVRARFAADIEAELSDQLANLLLRQVFESEQELEPLTRPSLSDARFDDDGSFHLVAKLEVRPRYALPAFDGFELPKVTIEVSDAEIEQELSSVAEEHATWEPADDAVAADGMLIEADLHGVMEDSDRAPYDEQGARFVLGHESVPGPINEALQGARAGDRRTAERRFPDDDPNPDRAGRTVRYEVDVRSIKRKVTPPIDEDLATTIGLESLDELRGRISEVLERNKRSMRRDSWRRALLDHLERDLDSNDLPSSLVQSAVREDLNRFAYSMAMQGMAPDSQEVNWQELAAKVEPGARLRVLDSLVLEQLAEEWQVEVPEAEVDAYVAAHAQRLGVPVAEHRANLVKEERLDGIRHGALMAATIDEMIRRVGGEVD